MKSLQFLFIICFFALIYYLQAENEQIIGQYPELQGGFENQATAAPLFNTTSATDWSIDIAGNGVGVIVGAGGRSGPKYLDMISSGPFMALSPDTNIQHPATDNYIFIQFWYQGDLDGQIGCDLNGWLHISGSNYANGISQINNPNTGETWQKAAMYFNDSSPAYIHAGIHLNGPGRFKIDDVVIYTNNEAILDDISPDSPANLQCVTSPTSVNLSWSAPGTGTDGGGYVVVRYNSGTGQTDINQNGIYAVGDPVGTTGSVVYIGTGSSYTDNDVIPLSTYWYKVYTVDKAFNRSAPLGSGSITVPLEPLTGILTIGPGGDYTTFTAAINDLNLRGPGTGGVTFNVTAGVEFVEEVPIITAIGTEANPIVFQKSGEGANPVIKPTTSTAGIQIQGGDYITFDGIDVMVASGSTPSYGYYLVAASAANGTQHNTINNSKITLNKTNTGTKGIYQYYNGYTATSSEGANSYNTYQNVTVENSIVGIGLTGNSSGFKDTECLVSGCTIGGSEAGSMGGYANGYGISLGGQNDVTVCNNEIRNFTSSVSYYNYGISLNGYGSINIFNNKVHGIRSSNTTSLDTQWGIVANLGSSGTNSVKIYNNMVWDITCDYIGTSTSLTCVAGIYIAGSYSANTYNVDFNTIRITGPVLTPSTGIHVYDNTAVINLRNNIVANYTGAQSGIVHLCVRHVVGSTIGASGSVSDNNIYYINNPTNGFMIWAGSIGYQNLAQWTTASGHDEHSYSSDPEFISSTDLHIRTDVPTRVESNGSYFSGAISWVTQDIDGNTRNALTPDIGADEGDFMTFPLPPLPAVLIAPADSTVNLALNSALQWSPDAGGFAPAGYRVYFGTSADPPFVQDQPDTIYSPTLDYGIQYFWKIVPYNFGGDATGCPTWSFTTIEAPLTDTLTIGPGGDYTTFTAAVIDLNLRGVGSGGVTFNVFADNSFGGVPVITATGTADNPIIFQKSGNGTNPYISTSTSSNAAITILGGDYFTFDGIDIRRSAVVASSGYYLMAASPTDGAQHNTIKNCLIDISGNPSTKAIYQYHNSYTPSSPAGGNSYNIFQSIYVVNCRVGINLSGNDSSPDQNCEIRDCGIGWHIGDYGHGYGIYASNQSDLRIFNNYIHNIESPFYTSCGIYLEGGAGTCEIFNNSIGYIEGDVEMPPGDVTYGMNISLSQVGSNTAKIYNNVIFNLVSGYGSTWHPSYILVGIRLEGAGPANNYLVDFNSIGFRGPLYAWSAGVYFAGNTSVNCLRNNLIINYTEAQEEYLIHVCVQFLGTTAIGAAGSVSDHNLYYLTNHTNGFEVRANGFSGSTLDEWKAASGQDANSSCDDPQIIPGSYVGIRTDVPTPVESGGSYFDGAITWVTQDFNGEPRYGQPGYAGSGTAPDIGAKEGDYMPFVTELDTPVLCISRVGNDIVLEWEVVSGASHYDVYVSDDPYTFPDTPVVTTETNMYSCSANAVEMFFRVVADSE